MKKYYCLLLLASLLACKQEKAKPTCNDRAFNSILKDTSGFRFLKADSFWTTCLDPQIDTYYRDFDLMNFKGISDTPLSNSFYHEDPWDNEFYRCYYACREIDSTKKVILLVDPHGQCDEEPLITYYPTQFFKEDGIWKAKCNNFEYTCFRSFDLDYERVAYVLIQENYRMYYFYYSRKKYDDGSSNQSYDGALYMFTDSSIVGFNHINLEPILNQKASVQLEKCNRIISSNKPSSRATYIKRYDYTFGVKGIADNEAYSIIKPFPVLGYLQCINHFNPPF